jgi:hypothetical protein
MGPSITTVQLEWREVAHLDPCYCQHSTKEKTLTSAAFQVQLELLMESIGDGSLATIARESKKEARRVQPQRGGTRRAIYATISASYSPLVCAGCNTRNVLPPLDHTSTSAS